MTNVLLFSTSTRSGSYNTIMVNYISSLIKGAKLNIANLAKYDMPIYNADIEANSGFPENALKFHKDFTNANGVIISTAEYNGSYPPLIKNAIDWISRIDLKCFYNKPVLIISASPSSMGGINASFMLKHLFMTIGSIIVPSKFCIVSAHNAFDEKGALKSSELKENLVKLLDSFMQITNSLKN